MNIDTTNMKPGEMRSATTTAADSLDNLSITATKVDTMVPGDMDMTSVMDQAAAESWDAAVPTSPYLKYALYAAAAYAIYKFVLKK